MSKRQLIDEIRRFNTTVLPQFLSQFSELELQEYLTHLQDAEQNHLRIGGWARSSQQQQHRLAS
jgi:hypothetical protein